MENEEYSVKENDALEEYQAYSEFNAESTVSEFQQYSKEGGYAGPEDQDYGKSSSNSGLTRHSSLLRNNRNRLGRMLSILAAMTGPAIAAILIMTTSLFADVRSYKTEPGSLEVTLSLYSSSDSTEFSAVLSDMDGNPVKAMAVDRNYPVLYFDGLTPGQIYLLEVFGDSESLLSYSYSIPETPPDPEETGDTDETGGGHGTGEETSEPGPAPAPSVTLFSQEATFNSAVIKLNDLSRHRILLRGHRLIRKGTLLRKRKDDREDPGQDIRKELVLHADRSRDRIQRHEPRRKRDNRKA